MPELRVDVPTDDLTILDAYCMATGRSRVDLVRDLINKFAGEQLHIAKVLVRCAGVNPHDADSGRQTTPPGR